MSHPTLTQAPAHTSRTATIGVLQRKCACGAAASPLTGECEECGKDRLLGIQTKLRVSEPGDPYEQEADRVADSVLRMPEPSVQRQIEPEIEGEAEATDEDEPVQLKPLASTRAIQRRSASGVNEHLDEETRRESTGLDTTIASRRIEAMRGSGQPLQDSLRGFFEPRFGVDFGKVRLHSDAHASEATRLLNARAFTLGRDIFFNAGEFQPASASGKRLLAHELTHVVQQGRTSTRPRRLQRLAAPMIQRATDTTDEGQGGDLDRADQRLIDWAVRKKKRGAVERWNKRLEKGQFVASKPWRQKRVRRVLELASSNAALANALGEAFIGELERFVGEAESSRETNEDDTASKDTETDQADTAPEPDEDEDEEVEAIRVPTRIKGAEADNPDALQWKDFKSTNDKPRIGGKKVIAATDVKPEFVKGRFIANFKKTSAVWSRVHPFDKQDDWIKPVCKPISTRCTKAVSKLGKDLSLVKRFPSGFEWNADLICAGNPSGTKDREVKSSSDCKALFAECSKANPIALKDQLLCHERGHLWIYALASARANEHLAAGASQPAVAKKLGNVIDSLVEDYELETNHACPTLGKTRCWDGPTVRQKVDAAWAMPEKEG